MMKTRKFPILLALLAVGMMLWITVPVSAAEKPNILVIMGDNTG